MVKEGDEIRIVLKELTGKAEAADYIKSIERSTETPRVAPPGPQMEFLLGIPLKPCNTEKAHRVTGATENRCES